MAQRGAVILLLLLGLSTGLALLLMAVQGQTRSRQLAQSAARTTRSLAEAKQALMAWSLSHKSTIYNHGRPGELPCPDLHAPDSEDAGWAGSNDDASCETAIRRTGRLPWKTLGLPRLLDGSGETLWYTVSTPFHDSDNSALNPDTPVAMPMRAHTGFGTSYPAAVALVFAPGSILPTQSRDTLAAQLDVRNYLDKHGSYDNTGLTSSSRFRNGPVFDGATLVLNDQLVTISVDVLLPKVMQRVLLEYPQMLRRQYPTPPYPPAQEGSCDGTPPADDEEGSDTNWLTRNQWEQWLSYRCSDLSVRAKPTGGSVNP